MDHRSPIVWVLPKAGAACTIDIGPPQGGKHFHCQWQICEKHLPNAEREGKIWEFREVVP